MSTDATSNAGSPKQHNRSPSATQARMTGHNSAKSVRRRKPSAASAETKPLDLGSHANKPQEPSAASPAAMVAPTRDLAAQEAAVTVAKASIPAGASRLELRRDPIYRIMHAMPRSDVLEVVRSRFATPHCIKAAAYFDLSYTKNPLRHLRLQIGCDGPTGVHLFLPRISLHRHTLRVVDLSRNRLSAEDVVLLCNALGLGGAGDVRAALPRGSEEKERQQQGNGEMRISPAESNTLLTSSSSTAASGTSSCLELLDLSYNTQLGDAAALHVLGCLRHCTSVRAVILKSIGLTDAGAVAISSVLRQWPQPVPPSGENTAALAAALLRPSTASATKFFLSLNENYIGAKGTYVLGKGLPAHVSLTLAKQRLPIKKEHKLPRQEGEDEEEGLACACVLKVGER